MTCYCGYDRVFILVTQNTICEWTRMDIVRVLRHIHRNPLFAFLRIARFAEFDWDVTVTGWISFEYEKSKYFFISPTPGETRELADGAEVSGGVYNTTRLIYREEVDDRGLYQDFAELAAQLFLENRDDYMEYRVMDE